MSRHDIRTKFHKDWINHSDVNTGDTLTDTRRHQRDLISVLSSFQNKESGKMDGRENTCNFMVLYKLGQYGGQLMWH